MREDLDQVIGGWILTGLLSLAAGVWVLGRLRWPLRLIGVVLGAHGVQGVHLGRRLASGHDDPRRRQSPARALAADAVLIAVLVAVSAGIRR